MNHALPGQVAMTPLRATYCILLVMFGLGLGDGSFALHENHSAMYLMGALCVGYLSSLWYRADAGARGIPHSGLLSGAVVVMPFAALPYYLLRSRQAAAGAGALAACAGVLVLMPLARLAGVGVHLAVVRAFA